MTQYLLSVYQVQGAPPPDPESATEIYGAVDALNQDLQAAGAWVFAGGLQPPDTATVVRIARGEAVLTDGPFPESKEHLGGFWIIDVADLDVALAWADRASRACANPVEVRPFQPLPES